MHVYREEPEPTLASLGMFTRLEIIRLETTAFLHVDLTYFDGIDTFSESSLHAEEDDIRLEERPLHSDCDYSEGPDTLWEFHADEGEPYMSDTIAGVQHLTDTLIDVLLASVKAFTLVLVLDGENTCILLQGLAERKAKELPKLERLIFEGYDPMGSDIKEALEANGIELGFGLRQENIWYEEHCPWMKDLAA
ncbi:hypothetical protein Q9189_006391 [Teloschistes chrysophthalmus]